MANRKGRELRKQVERAMREEGARSFSLSTTGTCHQRLDFKVDGFEGHFTFASTPGGTRETLNACAAARRAVRRTREKGLEASNSLEEVHPRWRAEPGSKLAALRAQAHRALDVHWEFGGRTRSEVYNWLADRLGVPSDLCHIGMFGEKECERVITLCRTEGP
jgi:zinc-finger-containing domain